MPAVTVARPDVTVDEVSAVLRARLGPRYTITPGTTSHFHHESAAGADSVLVRRNWFEQASIRVIPGQDSTEIRIGNAGSFTPTGMLLNRASIMHKVHQVLEHAPELAGS
jgi:hypothetical protein